MSAGSSSKAMQQTSIKYVTVKAEIGEKIQVGQRPCPIYFDVSLPQPGPIDYLVFKNYFVGFITISVANDELKSLKSVAASDGAKWTTVLKDYRLMKYPHYENDAEDWHRVCLSEQLGKARARFLRIHLIQPSHNWRSFELRNMTVYAGVTYQSLVKQNETSKALPDSDNALEAQASQHLKNLAIAYNQISAQRDQVKGLDDIYSDLIEGLENDELVATLMIGKTSSSH
eukprot:GFYU01009044.1.p1 GENE.GFYU01009044.1~~GFYU01009044.1.p1  ORF type:complete len:229 (+),score=35.09 GFYU01009044.1:105-791(+)